MVDYRLVFCTIGCCDVVDPHQDVATMLDDFLWLRLIQIESSIDSAQDEAEVLRLPQLQTQLLEEYGAYNIYTCIITHLSVDG